MLKEIILAFCSLSSVCYELLDNVKLVISREDEAGALFLFLLAVLKVNLFCNLLADVSLENGLEHLLVKNIFPEV